MIRHVTYMNMSERFAVAGGLGKKPVFVNTWLVLKKMLEEGDDTFIWVVTRRQMDEGFVEMLKKYDLEKFCVVKMLDYSPGGWDEYGEYRPSKAPDKEGITNFNYTGDKRKLKLFVMKGAKA